MRVATASEMRQMDATAMSDFHLPGVVLMENAGLAVFDALRCYLPPRGGSVVILCGPGNNGGDGYVVARQLLSRGVGVLVYALCEPGAVKGDAAVNLTALMAIDGGVVVPRPTWMADRGAVEAEADRIFSAFSKSDVIVDAIFGTGMARGMPEGVAALSRIVRHSGKPVVAVDIPTGVDADTGKAALDAVRATQTVTFGLPKVGLVVEPGRSFAGEVTVANISMPPVLLDDRSITLHQLTKPEAADMLPKRPADSHKGTFGKVVIAAGSTGMSGAAFLASSAAVRSGAGLVTACVPSSIHLAMETKTTEAMTVCCLSTPDGTFSVEAARQVESKLERAGALVLGPGLGRGPEVKLFVSGVLETACRLGIPTVLDADGLWAVDLAWLRSRLPCSPPIMMTPHPGEMAALLGLPIESVQAERLALARRCAVDWGTWVVLKGAATVVASPDGTAYINPTGNPGMATGGTGDVLAGIIGGLVAQGMAALHSCALGVYVHGLAGDLARDDVGMAAMSAVDVLEHLPHALKSLEAVLHEA